MQNITGDIKRLDHFDKRIVKLYLYVPEIRTLFILREHEGRPVELGGRVKGCFKKDKEESSADSPTKTGSGLLKGGLRDQSRPGLNKKVKNYFLL